MSTNIRSSPWATPQPAASDRDATESSVVAETPMEDVRSSPVMETDEEGRRGEGEEEEEPMTNNSKVWSRLEEYVLNLQTRGGSLPSTDPGHFPLRYTPPTPEHRKMFARLSRDPNPNPPQLDRPDTSPPSYGAGWVLPDEDTDCPPVIVASSLPAFFWFARYTLPADTLDDETWGTLAKASLAACEQKPLAQYREVECTQTQPATRTAVAPFPSLPSSTSSPSTPLHTSGHPEDKEKRQKRVHKREKELFRLVPFFLPLLDAQSAPPPPPTKKGEERQGSGHSIPHDIPSPAPPDIHMGSLPRDVPSAEEHGSTVLKKSEEAEHLQHPSRDDIATEKRNTSDSVKKVKRPAAMKKSSLRNGNEKSRRKRVSLVIDDQIVLPADLVTEPSLTSPSDTAPSSASTSTTSLEEMIDPRLMSAVDSPPREHQETVPADSPTSHRSLNSSTDGSATPTVESGRTSNRAPATISSPTSPSFIRSPVTYTPVNTGRTLPERSPPKAMPPRNIPEHGPSAPIYASLSNRVETGERDFSSYVGGIDGSGVDDLNQAGSLGFPSSLGASYMESYMQSRPLSVRRAAAEKAGLNEEDIGALVDAKVGLDSQDDHLDSMDLDPDIDRGGVDMHGRPLPEDEDMAIVGSMEGF